MTFLRAGIAQRLTLLQAAQSAQEVSSTPLINLEGSFNTLGSLNPDHLSDQPSRAVALLIHAANWECPTSGYEQALHDLCALHSYVKRLSAAHDNGTAHAELIQMAVHEDTARTWPAGEFIEALTTGLLSHEYGDPAEALSDFSRDLSSIIAIAHGSEDSWMSSGMPA